MRANSKRDKYNTTHLFRGGAAIQVTEGLLGLGFRAATAMSNREVFTGFKYSNGALGSVYFMDYSKFNSIIRMHIGSRVFRVTKGRRALRDAGMPVGVDGFFESHGEASVEFTFLLDDISTLVRWVPHFVRAVDQKVPPPACPLETSTSDPDYSYVWEKKCADYYEVESRRWRR